MNEKKLIKYELIKNMLYSFITFTAIFTIFGFIIFNNLKSSLYKSVDMEIIKTADQVSNFKIDENFILIKNNQNINKANNQIKQIKLGEIINPRIMYILRDDNGKILNEESMGRLYEEFAENINFQSNNLDEIYNEKINDYIYRGINIKTINKEGEIYFIQLLINVDAEENIIANYLNIFIVGIIITIGLSIVASYILSKKTLNPIVKSWKKQIEFVQNASHELRTPLTIIQTKQELLLQNPESKIIDVAEDIRLSLNEVKRLGRLTKDLMLLANADSNQFKIKKEKIEIDELIKEIVKPYKEFAKMQDKKVILNLNYKNKLLIDKDSINQLIIILLDNAIKYTESKDEIKISTINKDNKCILKITDTGIGISEDTLKHAFDRFYREDKARKRETRWIWVRVSYCKIYNRYA